MLKNLKTALFQTFSTWHPNTFCPHRLILTLYHQVPTSTALNWPSTIMYQQLPPSTDPVPPSTNKYHPLLTQYHPVSTSTALYWPRVPSSCPWLPGDYRLLHSLPWVLFNTPTPFLALLGEICWLSVKGGGARTFFFGNVVRGKSACPEKRFRTLRPESFAHRKLLPRKFWVFAPLLESSLDIQNRIYWGGDLNRTIIIKKEVT